MLTKTKLDQRYINMNSNVAFKCFTDFFQQLMGKTIKNGSESIVFVCIGTDRSTGDSLGPLIGYKLKNIKYNNVHIFGTLENPVHAKNLGEVLKKIDDEYTNSYIIAIDACLGKPEHVGYITIGEGPIRPGSGVNKSLPPVGDAHITGIVNYGGLMDFLILQNTRLSLVMKMADLISSGIRYSLWKMSCDRQWENLN